MFVLVALAVIEAVAVALEVEVLFVLEIQLLVKFNVKFLKILIKHCVLLS